MNLSSGLKAGNVLSRKYWWISIRPSDLDLSQINFNFLKCSTPQQVKISKDLSPTLKNWRSENRLLER